MWKRFLVKKYFCRKILMTRGEKVWETFVRAEDDGPSRARIKFSRILYVSGQKIFHQKNICDKGHRLVSKLHIAEVAQLVEHSPEEGRVTGSTPVLSTNKNIPK
jgi:hypothetical protein